MSPWYFSEELHGPFLHATGLPAWAAYAISILAFHLILCPVFRSPRVFLGLFPHSDVKRAERTQWWLVHCFGNLMVTAFTLPGAMDFFANFEDIRSMRHISSAADFEGLHPLGLEFTRRIPYMGSAFLATSLHILHLAFYKTSREDKLHHWVFVVGGAIAHVLIPMRSPEVCSCHLFLTGLPGSIDYFLLFLVDIQAVSKQTRHWLYMQIGNKVRAPALVLVGFMSHRLFDRLVVAKTVLMLFMTTWNGIYYAEQVSVAYGRQAMRVEDEKKHR